MGTFIGHALPGSFFLIFGFWSLIFQLNVYYRRKRFERGFLKEHVPVYQNQITYACDCSEKSKCFSQKPIPIDSILKIVCCSIGIIGEVFTGFNDGKFAYMVNAQHATMYSMFLLSGGFEVIRFYNFFWIPDYSDYIFAFLAITVELILFAFHLHGRTPLDVYVHTLLVYVVLILVVVGLYEAIHPESHLAGFLRSFLIILQGTWFWHVGAILYPPFEWLPRWDALAPGSIPRAANAVVYHLLAIFTVFLLLATAMGVALRRRPVVLGGVLDSAELCLLKQNAHSAQDSDNEVELFQI